MEVFTLCDCGNITNIYVAHCEQQQITIRKKSHSVNELLGRQIVIIEKIKRQTEMANLKKKTEGCSCTESLHPEN